MKKAGAPEGIRTPDLCLRRATLYPAELRAQNIWSSLESGYILSRREMQWELVIG